MKFLARFGLRPTPGGEQRKTAQRYPIQEEAAGRGLTAEDFLPTPLVWLALT